MEITCTTDVATESPAGVFANTHWSVVMQAKEDSATALNALCLAYRSPLIAWLRCRGERFEDAEDRVQGFFDHLLRHVFYEA
jgi:hypothetical protein